MKSAIAENVKRIIKDNCFKQSAIAEKAGYTCKSFNNMLNGRKIITDIDVAKIANVLKVEPNDLYRKTEEAKAPCNDIKKEQDKASEPEKEVV